MHWQVIDLKRFSHLLCSFFSFFIKGLIKAPSPKRKTPSPETISLKSCTFPQISSFEKFLPLSILSIFFPKNGRPCPFPKSRKKALLWQWPSLMSYLSKKIFTLIVKMTLTFKNSEPKFNSVHLLSKCNAKVKYQTNRSFVDKLLIGNDFSHLLWQWPWPWPSDPISIGVIYCPRPMHMWSIKPIRQFDDELLIGNELVYRKKDRQTDPPTDIQQNYIPLFFVGRHN